MITCSWYNHDEVLQLIHARIGGILNKLRDLGRIDENFFFLPIRSIDTVELDNDNGYFVIEFAVYDRYTIRQNKAVYELYLDEYIVVPFAEVIVGSIDACDDTYIAHQLADHLVYLIEKLRQAGRQLHEPTYIIPQSLYSMVKTVNREFRNFDPRTMERKI